VIASCISGAGAKQSDTFEAEEKKKKK